ISLAIAQLTAGGGIAGPDAGKPIADVEDLVPVRQLDPAVDAELEQLDGVDVLLGEVGIDRLGIAAMSIDGEDAPAPGLAAQGPVERPVVGIDLLAWEHQVIAPEEIEMPVARAAVLLARGDRNLAAADDGSLAQATELGRVHGLHQTGVRAGRLVVGQ